MSSSHSRLLATGMVALAMFATPTAMVSANSSGLGIPCDVDNPTLGRADRMKAYLPNNASAIWPMWWATPQQWSNDLRYTLRAGDGPAGTDATSYTPGQYTEITIRTNVQDKQFTGLLMYAVNAAGQKVGEWLLPPRQSFQVDPASGCVTHSNADPKKYKSVFRVKFPKGTGTVTIKALVKYGLAFPELQGEFWYPNSQQQGHLKLTEGAQQNQVWFQGGVGQSCNQVCQAAGGQCDLPTMKATGSSSALLSAVAKTSTCFGPLMKGCGAYSPTAGSEGCWYQDATCTREPVTTDWDPCTAGGTKPYVPGKVYQPNNANDPPCCSYQGFKWCANYYITETPNERQYGPWRKVSACAPATGNPTIVPPQTARPPVAMDCTSTKNSDKDGRRLCACSGVTGTPVVTTSPTTKPSTPTSDVQPDTPTSIPDDTQQPQPGTTTRPRTTVAPGGQVPLNDGTGKNAGSRMAPHMLITLFSVLLGAIMSPISRSSRAIFTIVAAIAILGDLPGSSAHNWLTSPSRGNGGTGGGDNNFNGNTSPPCPPKGTRVHAQVAAGQRFQMEWASGHGYGSSTYLAVLRASDEAALSKLTFDIMDDYIKNAPANANYMGDSKAYHVSPVDASRDKSYINQDITSTFVRPANFRKYPKVYVYSKTAAATANDKRVSYTSTKYPYLVAVHKFALHEDRPDEMDGAWMEIPQGFPSGQYVIQYQWRGYYDCMDINVLDVQSTDIYGSPAQDNTGMDKYLHTMYTPSLPKYQALDKSCRELQDGDTIEACQNECLSKNDPETGCTAVTVAPATLNTAIVKFKGMFSNGQSHLPPTCAGVAKNPNNLVCYLVHAGQAPSVGPAYKAVSDPEDPVFYMTTYIRKSGWTFAQQCAQCVPPLPPADFRFSDKCISCADVARNFFTQAPPRWNFIDNCQHCDNTLG